MHPVSARLTFRDMSPDDLDDMALLLGDPEVMTYYPRPKTRAEAARWIAWNRGLYRTHGYGLWLLSTTDGCFVGDCGLAPQVACTRRSAPRCTAATTPSSTLRPSTRSSDTGGHAPGQSGRRIPPGLRADRARSGAAAVLLLHGWPGDRTDYREVVPLVSAVADVVVPDLRGFGESDKHEADPGRQYTAAAQALHHGKRGRLPGAGSPWV